MRPSRGQLLRVVLLIAFTLVAFGSTFYETALSIAGGSPLAYLAVLPILLAMIAVGSAPPRGVGDAEADWILAGVVGGLGLLAHFLLEDRFPTLSGLWKLPLIAAVIWVTVAATILFGVRRVANKWPVWLFALFTATPLPYLMTTAWLGGSTLAAAAVAAALGAVAVFLAGRQRPTPWRLAATAACLLLGVSVAVALRDCPLLLAVAVSGGAVPVVTFAVLTGFTNGRPRGPLFEPTPLPHRSPLSIALLAVLAVVLLALNTSRWTAPTPPPQAQPNWPSELGLVQTDQFDFVQRYLGPDASFVRYTVPSRDGYSEAAVDVISADNLERLRTYRDVVWYPVTVMPNYTHIDVGNPAVTDARAAASDSSAATDATAKQWYAVTWVWRTGDTYQQVFVTLNQDPTSAAAPPAPELLSLRDTLAAPVLWLSRQQANPSGEVDSEVSDRANDIIAAILRAGAPRRG
ncbi:hypothetical protein B1R94_03380 [Mycolicibacterium litorale]|nr:hypothetical protein B1R94_03380 [Mycolicibacterium litorale]